MKKLKEELKYGKKGITLIALIITIIVLLILAGVTIATLTGNNGILTRATEAKNKIEEAHEKEGLELAVTSSQMEDVNTLEITEEKLSDAIKQQFGNNKDFSITDNRDGSFLVNMNDTQRMYYIAETGEVIDQSKMLKISTADELKSFRDDVNSENTYEGWYIYLANDITLDINEEWEPIGLSSPDGETNNPFKGTFDGRNYEINGLYINTTDKSQGLFGLVTNGIVKNTGIGEECNIKSGNHSGAVVGDLVNSFANNCYNKSDIEVGSFSGGVFGHVEYGSKIKNCYNLGNIITSDSQTAVGGVIGATANPGNNVEIHNCYNEGNINGDTNTKEIGGVIGRLGDFDLLNCCFNKGDVNGHSYVGGVAGNTGDDAILQNSYNTGNVTGSVCTGGIVGRNYGEFLNCYNIGIISGQVSTGGIVGENTYWENLTGIIRNSYSLSGSCQKLVGLQAQESVVENSMFKTENEMKSLVSTLGIAFKQDTNNINNGYPILTWQ